jgi:cytoskeletal protein RodZ
MQNKKILVAVLVLAAVLLWVFGLYFFEAKRQAETSQKIETVRPNTVTSPPVNPQPTQVAPEKQTSTAPTDAKTTSEMPESDRWTKSS